MLEVVIISGLNANLLFTPTKIKGKMSKIAKGLKGRNFELIIIPCGILYLKTETG